ncbi:MAG: RNA polymerase sigma factor [Myxococcales bacterium]
MLVPQHFPLVDAARRGEPVAIEQLLRLCRPDVRRYAERWCTISQIDDAVQETLLVVVRKIHLLQTPVALYSWLFKVVQRQCRRLGRALFRYDPFEEAKVDAWLSYRTHDEAGLDLVHAFDALPAHYREVIILRDFGGLTIKEISERIGLSTVATKSRLHRARELTREYLLS